MKTILEQAMDPKNLDRYWSRWDDGTITCVDRTWVNGLESSGPHTEATPPPGIRWISTRPTTGEGSP